MEDKEEGGAEEDIYEGIDAAEIEVEGEESTNDVIVVGELFQLIVLGEGCVGPVNVPGFSSRVFAIFSS